MDKSAQSHPTAWPLPSSIIFPVCVITVALSAISPAASVVRRELAPPGRGFSVRLVAGPRTPRFDNDGKMLGLRACVWPEADPTE
jgi:hypothetical protein